MTDHPEYTLSRPPSCPRNQDHLRLSRNSARTSEIDFYFKQIFHVQYPQSLAILSLSLPWTAFRMRICPKSSSTVFGNCSPLVRSSSLRAG